MIVLFGKLKGEDQYREHLIPCINTTKSGIKVRNIIQRLVQIKEKHGLTTGPAISDINEFLLPTHDLDAMFHTLLMEIFEINNSYFPPTVTNQEDIGDNYRLNRVLRRTVNIRALEEKVDTEYINLVGKWEQEGAGKRNYMPSP